MADPKARLALTLMFIRNCDPSYPHSFEDLRDYDKRNMAIYHAIGHALQCGYRAGICHDPADPDWPIAYIDLPTGQVSWHVPAYRTIYDGHSTEEKYGRIDVFVAGLL